MFVAAAGGAAHLAGVVASKTLKPVLGVPMETKLGGLDSLLSTVQMPAGIPVATLAIGRAGAVNAALLAAAILALEDEEVASRLRRYRKEQSQAVLDVGDPSAYRSETSTEPGDAEARRGARIRVRPERSGGLGRRQLAKESVEPARCREHQQAPLAGNHSTLGVRDAAGREGETSGADAELFLADREHVLALEHVEELVLALVDVERRVRERGNLLEERERAAGALARRPDEDRELAEHEALAGVRLERVRRQSFHRLEATRRRARLR